VLSIADKVALLPTSERVLWFRSLPKPVQEEIPRRPWWLVRRPEQKCPEGSWFVWLILSGRGWGKSRTGAETLLEWIIALPEWDGIPTEWAIFAETKSDAREICVLGPSGLVRAMEKRGWVEDRDYQYNKSLGVITLLAASPDPRCKGQKIHVQGADDPDVGRGLNLSGAWLDEYAKWPYPTESWTEGILPSLRIGPHPKVIITTTPKPIAMLKQWVKRRDGSVHVTRGSTFDNAGNLSAMALQELQTRYEGTRIGRQELHGELLDDVEGALWQRSQIDKDRLLTRPVELVRVVVAVDPAVTSGENADETGIVVSGKGTDGKGYVLADRSLQDTPKVWAQRIVDTYREFNANEVVIEVNNGGEALQTLIHLIDPTVPVVMIHAKQSKRVRAEPVSALYEQHRIVHIGPFDTLEDQLCSWTPEEKESPDRMDALVYSILALFDGGAADSFLASLVAACPVCSTPRVNGVTVCGH
jgi:phage terminase large subunit-like protein